MTDYSAGDMICRNCGIVLCDRIIEEEAEWHNYANDDRKDSASAARSSLEKGTDGQPHSIITGGSSAERKSLTRMHMKSSYSNKEISIIDNIALMSDIGYKLGLNERIMVSISLL
jgi:transcription initiation factor TFIIB